MLSISAGCRTEFCKKMPVSFLCVDGPEQKGKIFCKFFKLAISVSLYFL